MKKFLVSLLVLLSANIVFSSTCEETTILQNWKDAELIFECHVIKKYDSPSIFGLNGKLTFANVIVTKVYKGIAVQENDTISILNNLSSADYPLEENMNYIVFTFATNFLNAYKCTGTISAEFEDYKSVIDSLNHYNQHVDEFEGDEEYKPLPVYNKIEIVRYNKLLITLFILSLLLNIGLFISMKYKK